MSVAQISELYILSIRLKSGLCEVRSSVDTVSCFDSSSSPPTSDTIEIVAKLTHGESVRSDFFETVFSSFGLPT